MTFRTDNVAGRSRSGAQFTAGLVAPWRDVTRAERTRAKCRLGSLCEIGRGPARVGDSRPLATYTSRGESLTGRDNRCNASAEALRPRRFPGSPILHASAAALWLRPTYTRCGLPPASRSNGHTEPRRSRAGDLLSPLMLHAADLTRAPARFGGLIPGLLLLPPRDCSGASPTRCGPSPVSIWIAAAPSSGRRSRALVGCGSHGPRSGIVDRSSFVSPAPSRRVFQKESLQQRDDPRRSRSIYSAAGKPIYADHARDHDHDHDHASRAHIAHVRCPRRTRVRG